MRGLFCEETKACRSQAMEPQEYLFTGTSSLKNPLHVTV